MKSFDDLRFKLEEQIMAAWNVTEDIKLLTEMVLDRPVPLSDDDIANLLIGLETLYGLRFEQLHGTFEDMLRAAYSPNGPCQREHPREQKSYKDLVLGCQDSGY